MKLTITLAACWIGPLPDLLKPNTSLMKDNVDGNAGANHRHEAGTNGQSSGPAANGHGPPRPPIDLWVVLDILGRRWHWLILAACLFAGGFFYLGLQFIKPKFTAMAQMERIEPMALNEALRPPTMTPETFVGLVRRLAAAGARCAAVTSMGGHFCIR